MYLIFSSSNLILTQLFAQVLSFLTTWHSQYTTFSSSRQHCAEVVGKGKPKGLGKWHSSHVQVSLILSHGGSNTEMLLSVPTSRTILGVLLPFQPSAQTKGGNVLSRERIRNICFKLYKYIYIIIERMCASCNFSKIIFTNLLEKGKHSIPYQTPPSLTKHGIPAAKLMKKSNTKKITKNLKQTQTPTNNRTNKSANSKITKIKQTKQHFSLAFVSEIRDLILTLIFQ